MFVNLECLSSSANKKEKKISNSSTTSGVGSISTTFYMNPANRRILLSYNYIDIHPSDVTDYTLQ